MQIDRPSTRRLIILTTHFGTNFSGGSTATHEIFVRIQHEFDEIIVICNTTGNHSFNHIDFRIYRNVWEGFRILKSFDDKNTVYYGDFYNSIWYVWTKKPFFFTYHDNWPEMTYTSTKDRLRSLFYLPVYRSIFRHAKSVIVVSENKKKYVASFTKNVHLIRNGFAKICGKNERQSSSANRILMVGNIEKRKYKLAYSLFKNFNLDFSSDVHIYGNILDKDLSRKLNSFKFIQIMGFQDSIPYQNYTCLVHTSMIENLPLSICESLFFLVPVIAFDVGGIHEIVNETNGLLIRPFDIKQMATSLYDVLQNRIKFSFENNDLSEYDWNLTSEKYFKILML